jgi:hypothetical protein
MIADVCGFTTHDLRSSYALEVYRWIARNVCRSVITAYGIGVRSSVAMRNGVPCVFGRVTLQTRGVADQVDTDIGGKPGCIQK